MATAGRALNPKKTVSPIKAPVSQDEWTRLMRQAISLAETQGDRRIHGLRKALVDGKAERMLRMMGIINVGDLRRVFPEKV